MLVSLNDMQLIAFNRQLSNFWKNVTKVKNTCKFSRLTIGRMYHSELFISNEK